MLKQPESEQEQTASSESSTPDVDILFSFMAAPKKVSISELLGEETDSLQHFARIMAQHPREFESFRLPLVARAELPGWSELSRTMAQMKRFQRNISEFHAHQKPQLREAAPVAKREPLSDAQIDFLESQIPIMAQAATQAAFWNTLTRGHSAVCAEGDDLVEIAPDGTRRFIKTLEPNVPFFEEDSGARP